MARDYKNRGGNSESARSPGWVWFVIGLLVGVFGTFLFHLSTGDRQPAGNMPLLGERSNTPAQEVRDVKKPAREQPPAPHYEFYNLLPEMEVVVPETRLAEPEPPKPAPAPAPAPAQPGERYVIQIGSFQQSAEADALKARLILEGFNTRIETAAIKGTIWHRVRVGPLNNLRSAGDTRDRLRKAGHNAVVLQLK